MSRFHPLTVEEVRAETRDAVVLTLRPRDEDSAAFAFTQGQYLTFRRAFDGVELRRSYSICAGLDEGRLKVGVKRVDGGAFSTWVNEGLAPGDVIEAMPPMGRFFLPLDAAAARHYLGFAGGSGITPLLSIVKTVLAREPGSRFTLVYANRRISSIMFREELEDLKNAHLGRFSVVHVLEEEAQDIDLFAGRIDAAKMDLLFRVWIEAADVDAAFICGPEPMMRTIVDGLTRNGVPEEKIRYELFASGQQGRAAAPAPSRAVEAQGDCAVEITLDGVTRSFSMPRDGSAVLDAALGQNIEAPWSCRAGVCSTCRAKVLEGEVEMAKNEALEDYEIRAGYVLSCQCRPLSGVLRLSYDE